MEMMNVNVCLFVMDKFNQIFTHLFFFYSFIFRLMLAHVRHLICKWNLNSNLRHINRQQCRQLTLLILLFNRKSLRLKMTNRMDPNDDYDDDDDVDEDPHRNQLASSFVVHLLYHVNWC